MYSYDFSTPIQYQVIYICRYYRTYKCYKICCFQLIGIYIFGNSFSNTYSFVQVTLYHWDLPQSLQDLGGWTNPDMAIYFEDFANVSFSLFGDRVKKWITVNEPYSICGDTYGRGNGAPHIKSPGIGDYLCGKSLLLAHARAYHLYDKIYKKSQNGEHLC